MIDFCLDRRFVVGPIDEDVPRCVLVDLAEGNSWINPQDYPHYSLLQNLMECKEKLITIKGFTFEMLMDCDKNDIKMYSRQIAAFVNPDRSVSWSLGGLVTAFKHMISINKYTEINGDFIFGPKTMDSQYSYNACMLYKLCKLHNIKTRPSMTLDEMAERIQILSDISNKVVNIPMEVRNFVKKKNNTDTLATLVETICLSDSQYKLENYEISNNTFGKLCKHYDKLSNVNKIIDRINPTSHEEAVIIAALKYNIDISESCHPISELELMDEIKSMKSKNPDQHYEDYEPLDPEFRRSYQKNSDWFKLKKTYSHTLSMVYTNKNLKLFVDKEGFSTEELEGYGVSENVNNNNREVRNILKNLLFQARSSNTFYYGNHPKSINDSTPIDLDDLEDTDLKSCVTHGSLEFGENLIFYKATELAEHFNRYKNFSNPNKINEMFTSEAIKKLKIICKNVIGEKKTDTQEVYDFSSIANSITTRNVYSSSSSNLSDLVGGSILNYLNDNVPQSSRNNLGRSILGINNTNRIPQHISSRMARDARNRRRRSTVIRLEDEEKKIDYNEEQVNAFKMLLSSIKAVEFDMIKLNNKATELKYFYTNANSETKELIEKSLRSLLEAGMCMRGWKVSTSEDFYPIKSADTVTPVGKQHLVDNECNNALHIYKESLDKCSKKLQNKLKNLPLVCVQITNDKCDFKKSIHENDGVSVWDRYNIVLEGNKTNNMSSCIRMSSNWFVSSAYYYMVAIGLDKPFNIADLSKIS